MARVWAHFSGHADGFSDLGTIRETPTGGWTHVHNFEHLSELIAWLMSQHLQGKVSHLNLNSHGTAGRLALDTSVRVAQIQRFAALGVYLRQPARLSFTGCTVGSSERGSWFLKTLSRLLWRRKVIGSERETLLGGRAIAGDIWLGFGQQTDSIVNSNNLDPGHRHVHAWHAHMKWAYCGQIIRYPAFEQSTRPNMTCARPGCPGHRDFRDQCPGPWNPGCEW